MGSRSTQVLPHLGTMFLDARHSSGTRIEQVAVAVNRSVEAIRSYETGKRCPPLGVFLDLCEFYDIPLTDILGEAS